MEIVKTKTRHLTLTPGQHYAVLTSEDTTAEQKITLNLPSQELYRLYMFATSLKEENQVYRFSQGRAAIVAAKEKKRLKLFLRDRKTLKNLSVYILSPYLTLNLRKAILTVSKQMEVFSLVLENFSATRASRTIIIRDPSREIILTEKQREQLKDIIYHLYLTSYPVEGEYAGVSVVEGYGLVVNKLTIPYTAILPLYLFVL